MTVLADAAAAFRPGLWALVALAVILVISVVIAKRERDRTARIADDLPDGAWSAPCLDATTAATKRLLIVDDEGIALTELSSGSRESWPWNEIAEVSTHPMRVRAQRPPGLRVTLVAGHERDLLVYVGTGRQSYQNGVIAALQQISRRHPDKVAK